MSAVSPNEEAGIAMESTWRSLDPVREYFASMARFVKEELPPGVAFTAQGVTTALRLCAEFREEIWPHYVPSRWELVLADRCGRLDQRIAELNQQYKEGK